MESVIELPGARLNQRTYSSVVKSLPGMCEALGLVQYHINKNKEPNPRGINVLAEHLAMDGFKVLEVRVPKMWFVNLVNFELTKNKAAVLVRKTETLDFWVRFFLNRALEGNAEGREAKDAGNASADSPVSVVPWFLLGPCSATRCTGR